MSKLNQVVAIEKGVKTRVYSEITELHKQSQHSDLFTGFQKSYRKKDEEGDDLPGENKKVQLTVGGVLGLLQRASIELFDVTATKDYANCSAVADVMIGDEVIIAQAPVTYLLFLEKQITDIRTFVEKLPTLDESENWEADVNSGLYKTPVVTTHRTKKVQKGIVLYNATTEHPAQTQLITEDIVAGYWDLVKTSGALPIPFKRKILAKVEELSKAVKMARETANGIDAPPVAVGQKIFTYLFT